MHRSEELGETGRQTLTNMVLNELARLPPHQTQPEEPDSGGKDARAGCDKAVAKVMKEVADAQSGSAAATARRIGRRGGPARLRHPDAADGMEASPGRRVGDRHPWHPRPGRNAQGMSTSKGALAKPGAWISLVGRLGSGVAEVAVTKSIGHLLRWHWLRLVVTFAGLTIVGGSPPAPLRSPSLA